MAGIKLITKNKKAFFDYSILERIEAGVVLTGAEVKSVKDGQVSLRDSFVLIDNEEAWLWNANITKYKYSSDDNYDPFHRRKLLLKRKEIHALASKSKQKGISLIPLTIYLTRGKVKVEVGLGRGNKQYDKKEKVKEREQVRELHRERRKYMVE